MNYWIAASVGLVAVIVYPAIMAANAYNQIIVDGTTDWTSFVWLVGIVISFRMKTSPEDEENSSAVQTWGYFLSQTMVFLIIWALASI